MILFLVDGEYAYPFRKSPLWGMRPHGDCTATLIFEWANWRNKPQNSAAFPHQMGFEGSKTFVKTPASKADSKAVRRRLRKL